MARMSNTELIRLKRNKYRNRKVEMNGTVYDSAKEANRHQELLLLEKAGKISDLRCQVEYELIPEQREAPTETYKKGPKKGLFKQGKLLEQKCSYIADFVYFDREKQQIVVEDTKGFKTKDYIIKRKLMLFRHGIRIQEI